MLDLLSDMWQHGVELRCRLLRCIDRRLQKTKKNQQRELPLDLLGAIRERILDPHVISYSAPISTCEKGMQWQLALNLLRKIWQIKGNPMLSVTAQRSVLVKRRAVETGC